MRQVESARAPAEGIVLRALRAADFGAGVAEAVAGGARLLHLTDFPGGRVAAFCDTRSGVRALLADGGGEPLGRLSAAGLAGALHQEAVLAAAGVAWAGPAPAAAVSGRGVFTFPLGPVRGDVAEAAGWRLDVVGDEVLGLRLRFGYKHRGLEGAMQGRPPAAGLALAERVTGTSPVAHGLAYCRAWEALAGVAVPPAAAFWRGVFAELERLHSHIGDLAALANATGLPVPAAELWSLKESVLRACAVLTGHRYLRGALAPGGVAVVPERGAAAAVAELAAALLREFGAVTAALDASTSFLDRLHGTGRVPPAWAEAVVPVGPVGRACGLAYDVRLAHPGDAYAGGAPEPALAEAGDAWARYRVRVQEVQASARWLQRRLADPPAARAPAGAGADTTSAAAGDRGELRFAIGRAEAPRGEVLYLLGGGGLAAPAWVRLRPPSAVNWAVVPPAAAENSVLQDIPIVDASFSLSVSAVDR